MKIILFLIVLMMPALTFGETTINDWIEWEESNRVQYFNKFLAATVPQLLVCNNNNHNITNSFYQGITDKEAVERLHKHLLVLVESNAKIDRNSHLKSALLLAVFSPIPDEDRDLISMITLEQTFQPETHSVHRETILVHLGVDGE